MDIVVSFVSFCLHLLDIQTQHFDCCGVSFAHWRVFIKTSCLQLFQELLIRENYFSWAVSTPGLIDVVLRSDVLNFSRITIAFLHCDLMRASLPFSAFCIS